VPRQQNYSGLFTFYFPDFFFIFLFFSRPSNDAFVKLAIGGQKGAKQCPFLKASEDRGGCRSARPGQYVLLQREEIARSARQEIAQSARQENAEIWAPCRRKGPGPGCGPGSCCVQAQGQEAEGYEEEVL
jgi:hypothetical protein